MYNCCYDGTAVISPTDQHQTSSLIRFSSLFREWSDPAEHLHQNLLMPDDCSTCSFQKKPAFVFPMVDDVHQTSHSESREFASMLLPFSPNKGRLLRTPRQSLSLIMFTAFGISSASSSSFRLCSLHFSSRLRLISSTAK